MLKIITANYKFEYDWVASCYKLLPFKPVYTKAKTSRHKHRICKIRVRPNARQVVITAGSPSGIAATAKATAILSSNGGMSVFYAWQKRISEFSLDSFSECMH